MNKKLMSSVLAGAMAVSTLSVAASAATATDKTVTAAGSTTFKVSATVAEAVIDVTVPSGMSAVVNPYGIEITVKGGQVYGATGFTSPVYTIKNNTLISAVMVSVTPTITVPTASPAKGEPKERTIAVVGTDADIATNETAKTKAIYAYVAGLEGTNTAVGTDPAALTIFNATTGATETGVTTAVFEDATMDEKGTPHTKSDLLLIPKADADSTDTTKVAKYGYAQLQMGGAVTNTNITPWTKSDKIGVNLVLDIAPCKSDATKGTYAGGGSAGESFADPADLTGAITAGTGASNVVRTGDTAYTAELSLGALGSATAITSVLNIPLASGKQILSVTSSDATVVAAAGLNVMVKANTGTTTLTIKTSSDGLTDDGQTITVEVTAVA